MSAPSLGVRVAALSASVAQLEPRLERTEAETVKVAGMVSSLGGRVLRLEMAKPSETPKPSPAVLPVDAGMPSEVDRIAMRERLRAGTLKGIEANKTDRNRAGGPITREAGE